MADNVEIVSRNYTLIIQPNNVRVNVPAPPQIRIVTAAVRGLPGTDGDDGLSAYEVAVENGFVGSESDWLTSLMGADGMSAYQVAVANGFVGSESAWLSSLIGASGSNGWSPILAVITDGDRRVLQVIDWTGGTGTKPTSGLYVGSTGLVVPIASGVDIRGPAGAGGGASNVNIPLIIALTQEGASAIVANTIRTIRAPFALTFVRIKLSTSTAPTGAALIVDIKKNGTTIFSTKPQIDAGALTSLTSGTPYVLAVGFTGFADDDIITFDVTQVGSTIAGAGLKVTLDWYKT